jgi:hypothetical protein
MTKPIYVCKKCGSDRIRQTVWVWYNSIEECGHRAETEHEDPRVFCENCKTRGSKYGLVSPSFSESENG